MMFDSKRPGGGISFESHTEKLREPTRTIITDLRKFVISLGSNVIEDIRPHRIVYSKTLNFRVFLDIEPTATGDSLILSIRLDRNTPPITLPVKDIQDTEYAKKQIAEAYQKIK
jgi:hypothetical protein